VNEDLSRLVLEARGSEGQGASPGRALDLIVRAVAFAAQNSPQVLDSDTCSCHIRIYARAWKKGRIQLLLHALVAIESSSNGDENDHEDHADHVGIAIAAIEKARCVLCRPDSYRVGTMMGRYRVTWSDPEPFAATEIVAQSTPDIGPSAWMFSHTRELERLSALPRDVANAHRAWLALRNDQLNLREQLEDAVFEYQFESGPPEIHSVRHSLAQVSEQWRAEWTARSHPITGDFPQNLFPFEVRSALDFTAFVNRMVKQGDTAHASETFPHSWYDTLRPTLLEAIAAIRRDLVVLARVNAAWEDAFVRWEPIAAKFGRRWKATP